LDSYIALLTWHQNSALYNLRSGSWLARANGAAAQVQPSIACANRQLDPR